MIRVSYGQQPPCNGYDSATHHASRALIKGVLTYLRFQAPETLPNHVIPYFTTQRLNQTIPHHTLALYRPNHIILYFYHTAPNQTIPHLTIPLHLPNLTILYFYHTAANHIPHQTTLHLTIPHSTIRCHTIQLDIQ